MGKLIRINDKTYIREDDIVSITAEYDTNGDVCHNAHTAKQSFYINSECLPHVLSALVDGTSITDVYVVRYARDESGYEDVIACCSSNDNAIEEARKHATNKMGEAGYKYNNEYGSIHPYKKDTLLFTVFSETRTDNVFAKYAYEIKRLKLT